MPFCWTSPASAYRRGGTTFHDETGKGWRFHENQYGYIAVADIDGLYRKLRKNNATSLQSEAVELMPWGERLFYMQDPFGTPICFVDESTVFKGTQ